MLKNQAYYAQNYAHKIKLCSRGDCFITVIKYFLTALLEYLDLFAEKCTQWAKSNKDNTNSCFYDVKICSVLIVCRIFGGCIAQLIISLKNRPIMLA